MVEGVVLVVVVGFGVVVLVVVGVGAVVEGVVVGHPQHLNLISYSRHCWFSPCCLLMHLRPSSLLQITF